MPSACSRAMASFAVAFGSSPKATRPSRRCSGAVCASHETVRPARSEEHTSELQSLMRISYAVFCLHKKKQKHRTTQPIHQNSHTRASPKCQYFHTTQQRTTI